MLAQVFTCAVLGLDGVIVQVEVDYTSGMSGMTIVGLPDTAIQESRERVQTAIRNSNFTFPRKRVLVNLAPASVRKEGPAYDLPIAVGVLAMTQQLKPQNLQDTLIIGELSLDGSVRHVRGVLSMAAVARDEGYKHLFVPACDAPEAALIPDISVIPIISLSDLACHLNGEREIIAEIPKIRDSSTIHVQTDFSEIKGQEHVKRALEVAAAGSHNILMIGPPGSGKTLLARAIPSILPKMSIDEQLEVTRIYSIADQLPSDIPLIQHRPYRSPHHTISHAGLVGGGNWPHPGEITLAHRGVLFLDEFPEFGSRVLEVLRQPIEDKTVTISRAQGSLSFPANFMLVAAMNPCPCGYYGDPIKPCTCPFGAISKYQKRVSGPMLDRIDIHIQVPRVDYEKLSENRFGENSETIRLRVEKAREIQRERFKETELSSNADMHPAEVRQFCHLDDAGQKILKSAMNQLHLSARSYHRILKLARTIADLAGCSEISQIHVAEALQWRSKNQEL